MMLRTQSALGGGAANRPATDKAVAAADRLRLAVDRCQAALSVACEAGVSLPRKSDASAALTAMSAIAWRGPSRKSFP